jgi:hypothetical protein
VYQPGRRETGGERATQRPFKRRTRGRPCRAQHPTPNTQHPTPNAQHPKNKPPRIATPSSEVLRNNVQRPPAKYPVRRPRRRRPRAPNTQKTPNTQHPTPNAQHPKNKPPRIATPSSEVLQNSVWRRPAKYPVRRPRRRRPRAPNTQKNAQHPTPNTQRPTPNAQHPTPNTQKMNPHGSRRQLEGCFRTTYRDALQSIPSGDLVVAAL